MCGRFTLRTPSGRLVEQFQLAVDPQLSPRYNIAPTQDVAVVRLPEPDGPRQCLLLRWGLVPFWAKDAAIGNRMINARSESVANKPAFRAAMKRRRCLVPADGYYEWRKTEGRKQPYYIRMKDDRPFAFAGLWERWEGEGDLSGPLETCTIITTRANDLSGRIHDRMPVILAEEDYSRWLDPAFDDVKRLEPLLGPFPSEPMKAEPVSARVNNPRHDDPACIEVQRDLF